VIAGAAARSHASARGSSSLAPSSIACGTPVQLGRSAGILVIAARHVDGERRQLRAMPLRHAVGVREHRGFQPGASIGLEPWAPAERDGTRPGAVRRIP
jgi:hypothetical protein